MQLTNEISKLFEFNIEEPVYLKQDVINDRSSMNVNGKDVEKILLQHSYIVVSAQLEVVDAASYIVSYIVRPHGYGFDKQTSYATAREHELCGQAEAIAILRLK